MTPKQLGVLMPVLTCEIRMDQKEDMTDFLKILARNTVLLQAWKKGFK